MDFQLLDADYTYIGNRPMVRLYGRDGSGKSVCCFASKFEPYFFVMPDNPEEVAARLKNRFREIDRIEHVEMFEPVGYSRTPSKMLKVVTSEPKGVAAIREEVRHTPGVQGIYETDILFANRFMIDHGLAGMGWVRAEEAGGADMQVECSLRFTAGRIDPVATLANAPLRYLSFDIECLPLNGGMPVPEKSPIIMMSLAFEPSYGTLGTLVLVGKKADVSGEVEAFSSEKEMLKRFFEIIRDYDPDVITGYNINGFDFPYIIDRLSALKGDINDRIGRDGRAASYRKIGAFPQVGVTGRVVADAMLLMKRDFSLKQYSLKFTAKEFLGMEKLDVAPLEMESYWNDGGERFRKLIEYARRDAVLALQFMRKLRLLDKYIALARASGVLLQDVLDGGQSAMVESILLREFRQQNRVVPPRPDSGITDTRDEESEELKGGEVLEPKRGLLENVVVLDYKSLYPTIMMAHNLCYTTVVTGDEPAEAETAPSGGRFATAKVKKGIVPAILERLLSERVETRKRMKAAAGEEYRVLDATQLALKILLNSFYGYS
ncbi:MAG TPA: DNA polymerase elongation subunit, partial [Candidatus Methanoperedenaceae archaeon]|nr:DNA polymerase elongation subunit [Candidatus Methanoperedenaceae archaeon]